MKRVRSVNPSPALGATMWLTGWLPYGGARSRWIWRGSRSGGKSRLLFQATMQGLLERKIRAHTGRAACTLAQSNKL